MASGPLGLNTAAQTNTGESMDGEKWENKGDKEKEKE